jgi:hypothetical protein
VLNDDGSVDRPEFYVEGRKCPLIEIRKRKLSELERFMRLNAEKDVASMSEEECFKRLTMLNGECETEMKGRLQEMERTRHLLVWHDFSTVAIHSHLVFLANCLYDPATFYTSSEYEAMTGRKVNIQSLVESTSLYIVARSSSSDADQLCYVHTRLECLEELSSEVITTASGEPLIDKMRFFHGDSPSRHVNMKLVSKKVEITTVLCVVQVLTVCMS